MPGRVAVVTFIVVTWASGTGAQNVPPGYDKVVEITRDAYFNDWPRINNRGHVVFSRWFDPYDGNTAEIYLWDNGVLQRLTDDYLADAFPAINDAGEIVWTRATVPNTSNAFEIVHWRNGELRRITYDDVRDYSDGINNHSWITWSKIIGGGCREMDADVWLLDDGGMRRLSERWRSNQVAHLNDLGDVVWTRYNFCYPWPDYTSEVMLYSEGVIQPLTGDQGADRWPQINNRRVVAWIHDQPPTWEDGIAIWKQGQTRLLTDWGGAPALNNRGDGDILFHRWHQDTKLWQVWLYRDGKFYQITSDPFWNSIGDINDRGDFVWQAGKPPEGNIKLMKRLPLGDLNCDRAVNNFDIDPFVLALVDPGAYEQRFPECDRTLGDVNLDGEVNNFDIDPFVKLLTK